MSPHDGGGLAKGGDVTLYYDGKPVGHGRVEQTQPMQLDIGNDSHDHLIKPEERFTIAMSQQ